MSTEKRRRAAAALIRRGVAVIPVPAGEKNPGYLGWQDLRITEEEVPSAPSEQVVSNELQ